MVTYEEYHDYVVLAARFGLLFFITLIVCAVFIALYLRERERRRRLEEEVDRLADPEQQVVAIQQLGAAGRHEVRRLSKELYEALQSVPGGRS